VSDAIRNICDHLVERSSTLFLGAGINAGIRNSEDERCPLGQDLSEWICRDLLGSPETKVALDDAVEMARYKLGPKPVNDYIYEKLETFEPGAAHLALVQLPWDVIYTTNFDLRKRGNLACHTSSRFGQNCADLFCVPRFLQRIGYFVLQASRNC